MFPRASVAKLSGSGSGPGATKKTASGGTKRASEAVAIQTDQGAENVPFASFAEFASCELPNVKYAEADNAMEMVVYCRRAHAYLSSAIRALSSMRSESATVDLDDDDDDDDGGGAEGKEEEEHGNAAAAAEPLIDLEERSELMRVRDMWIEHLCAYKYSLWLPPPLSGGVTASYSLATQLWLLVLHANALLQCANCVPELVEFYPPACAYLSEQRLVLDTEPLVNYTQRVTLLTLCNFVERLDTLTHWAPPYRFFVRALEHRVAALVCFGGEALDAAEWCVVRMRVAASAAAPAAPVADEPVDGGARRVSEEFLTHTMVLFCTLREYEENAHLLAAHCQPAQNCATQAWLPPLAGASAFLCMYSRTRLLDESFRTDMRNLLRYFALRPCDLDLYRIAQRKHDINAATAVAHQYEHRSQTMDAYSNHLQFEAAIHEYVAEAIQWRDGCATTTASASLGIGGFVAQLATLFVWNQFLLGTFRFDFRHQCVLFHRDAAFPTTLRRITSNGAPYPILVQQFGYFMILVPPHRRFVDTQLYRCDNIFEALATWSVWLLSICGGQLRSGGTRQIDLRPALNDIYGAAYLARALAAIDA
jgi:hypothetical protein